MSSSEDDDLAEPEVGRVSNFAKRFEQKINEAAGTQTSVRRSVSLNTPRPSDLGKRKPPSLYPKPGRRNSKEVTEDEKGHGSNSEETNQAIPGLTKFGERQNEEHQSENCEEECLKEKTFDVPITTERPQENTNTTTRKQPIQDLASVTEHFQEESIDVVTKTECIAEETNVFTSKTRPMCEDDINLTTEMQHPHEDNAHSAIKTQVLEKEKIDGQIIPFSHNENENLLNVNNNIKKENTNLQKIIEVLREDIKSLDLRLLRQRSIEMGNYLVLQQEKSQVDSECRQLRRDKIRTDNEIEQLRQEKSRSENENQQLREENSQLENDNQQLRQEKCQSNTENQQLQKEKCQSENENQQLREENSQLENGNQQLRLEKSQSENENQQLREENSQLENGIQQLRQEKCQSNTENQQLRQEKCQSENENQRLREENSQLENGNQQLRQEKSQSNTENQQLRQEKCQSDNENQQLREENSQLENGIQQLREENTNRNNEIRQHKENNSSLRNEIQQLREENDDMSNEMQDIRRSMFTESGTVAVSNEVLGKGGWGVVNTGDFHGTKVAVKQFYEIILSPHNRKILEREIKIASQCRHPNLLQFICATQNAKNQLLIITELMDVALRTLIEQHATEGSRLKDQDVKSISLDVAKGLNYLHLKTPKRIIHRDVSSANVLLWIENGSVRRAKLSDYGSANFMHACNTVNPGAALYAAPEARSAQHDPKIDVFSYGLLVCEMFNCELPDPEQIGRKRQIRKIVNAGIKRLVEQCTEIDPEERPTMQDVIGCWQEIE